jgi:nucleoside 2-deoxyribosyltransferase
MTRRIRAPAERKHRVKKVYLAGPDVFMPDAMAVGRRKQEICRQFGFEGLFPLDRQITGEPSGTDIFRADMALMREADIGLFNLSPFRGPSADPGTVFELGMMMAMGKRVFGYRNTELLYHQRVRDDGYMIERFGLGDNLMIDCAIVEAGGSISAESQDGLAAMISFQAAVEEVWRQIFGVMAS